MTHRLKKAILHIIGFIVIALGIANILTSKLGASPIDAFNYFLFNIVVEIIPVVKIGSVIIFTVTIGSVIIFTGLVVTLLAFLFNKDKDMVISAVFLIIVGVFVDMWLFLLGFVPAQVTSLVVIRILMASVGMLLCAFGVAITILTGFPASPYERLMLVIHKRINNLSLSKIIVEGSFFVLAVILGLLTQRLFEQVHIFTVVMTFMMGILVSMFTHIIRKKFIKGDLKYGT
ncbi:MAG: hypothetical protein WC219_04950 [Acholeplasmataceae bacterium]